MNKMIGIAAIGIGAYLLYEWYQQQQQQAVAGNVPVANPNAVATNAIPATNANPVQNFPYTSTVQNVTPPQVTNAFSYGSNPPPTAAPGNVSMPNTSTLPTTDLATNLMRLAGVDINGTMGPDQWSYYLAQSGLTLSPSQFDSLYTRSHVYTADQFVAALHNVGLAGLGRVYASGAGLGLGVIGRGYGINSLTPNDATRYEMSSKYVM